MSKRSKFVFLTWVGSNVSVMKKAKMSTDKLLMKEIIQVGTNSFPHPYWWAPNLPPPVEVGTNSLPHPYWWAPNLSPTHTDGHQISPPPIQMGTKSHPPPIQVGNKSLPHL